MRTHFSACLASPAHLGCAAPLINNADLMDAHEFDILFSQSLPGRFQGEDSSVKLMRQLAVYKSRFGSVDVSCPSGWRHLSFLELSLDSHTHHTDSAVHTHPACCLGDLSFTLSDILAIQPFLSLDLNIFRDQPWLASPHLHLHLHLRRRSLILSSPFNSSFTSVISTSSCSLLLRAAIFLFVPSSGSHTPQRR